MQSNKNLVKAVIDAINSYSLDIILVDENMIIYIGELYHNKDGSNAAANFCFISSKMLIVPSTYKK